MSSNAQVAAGEVREAAQAADVPARRHGIADRLAFWLFVAMVAVAPLPDGSVGPIWVVVWTAVAAVVVLLADYRDVGRGGALLIGGLVALLAAYGLVAWLQSLSPGPAPLAIWSQAAPLLGMDVPPLASSVRDAPLLFLGRPLLGALVLTAGIAFGTDRARSVLLCRVIVAAACLYGTVGLVALVADIRSLRPYDQRSSLIVFFINRNTSATYLGSAFLIAMCLFLAPLRGQRGFGLTGGVQDGGSRRGAILTGAAAIYLMILLALTQSRAGLLLTLGIALVFGALYFRTAKTSRWLLLAVVLGVFALVYFVSGDVWRQRQAGVGFDTGGRIDLYLSMLAAIAQHPALGLGLGSFEISYPQFRPPELGLGLFNIGHSTPLELVFEGGIPLALLVGAYVLLCFAVLVRGALRHPKDPVILAALLVGLLGALHSSIDFSLQIPGYLIIYLALVGMGLGRAFLPERVAVVQRRARRTGRSSGDAEKDAPALPPRPVTDGIAP